jgi:hypothetical protein
MEHLAEGFQLQTARQFGTAGPEAGYDGLTVDSVGQGAAHQWVAQRGVRRVKHQHADIVDRTTLDLEPRIALDAADLVGRNVGREVHLAGE